MGARSPDIDFQAAWTEELRRKSASKAPPPRDGASQRAGWSTEIPVQAYVVTLRGAAYPDKDGLLQPLLRRWQARGCSYSVFALPAVQAVIDWKWTRYAQKLHLLQLFFFLLWMVAFYSFTAAFQDEDTTLTLSQLWHTSRGKFSIACDCMALVGMAPFLFIEAATVHAYGLRGWAVAYNLLDVVTYILQLSIVFMHLGRLYVSSGWLSIAAAALSVLLLFRLQYFSRVFPSTRFSFFDDLTEVLRDVRWYLIFLVLIILGYSVAFQILFRADQKQHQEFSNLGYSFIQMITWAAGNADLNPLYSHSQNPITACVLGVSFVLILGMVLLNLLIGLMTTSLDKITKNEDVRLLLSRAQGIDEIEATLPRWLENKFPDLFPPFLFVLRVDPGKLDAVQNDAMWAGEGDDERTEVLLGGGNGGGGEASGAAQWPANENEGDMVKRTEGGGGDLSGLKDQIGDLVGELRALRVAMEAMQQRQARLRES